jgi:hypothetical protein
MAADALTEGAQAATLYRQLIAAHPDEYDADPDSYRDDYEKRRSSYLTAFASADLAASRVASTEWRRP